MHTSASPEKVPLSSEMMASIRLGSTSQSLQLWFNGLSMFYSTTFDINCFLSVAQPQLCSMEAMHKGKMCPLHNRTIDAFWMEWCPQPSLYLQIPLLKENPSSHFLPAKVSLHVIAESPDRPGAPGMLGKDIASWLLMMVPEILEKLRNREETEL